MTNKLAVVLKGYPRLSETFISQEILSLQRAGFDLQLISLRHPTDKSVHPVNRQITAPVSYLPEYVHDEPLRVLAAWWHVRKLPGYRRAWRTFLADLRRDFTRNRFRRFAQAMVIAREHAPHAALLYAHFIHTPTSATRYAAMMADKPFAVSAHAKDIWTTPDWELSEKLADCLFCATCTAGGAAQLRSLAPDPARVHLIYHGLDLSRFARPPKRAAGPDGSKADKPVQIVTVGRAVAKKGLDTLLDALARLPQDFHWRWEHIGGGPLRDELIAQAGRLRLSDRVEFRGALAQEDVIAAYRASDLFVLPCRIDETGDRDGLPNVFIEAQSQGLAVISTPISGIPELIADNENGLLVEPDAPDQLAGAIERLGRDPSLRKTFGEAGEAKVRGSFDHDEAIVGLVDLLRVALGETPAGKQRVGADQ